MMFLPSSFRHLISAAAALACLVAVPAQAVQFTLVDHTGDLWTYDLTYDPLDNYAIPGQSATATISLSGLSGVAAAFKPTSTDFEDSWLSNLNMQWTPEVLNGGTEVRWTHVGSGTGNFDVPKHVYGFQIQAPGAISGTVNVSTTGFSTDTDRGLIDRDINMAAVGPVPEPEAWALMLAGVAVMGACARRRSRIG